ncbi:phage replication initiation protein, NGO0469 family [Butyricicoccus sp.]|uniref:phage replication initiation protein, NGO0469 family n=1 Tax=Butyricicoccus sp. TaxID=2049021 RepID=UPI003F145C7C
MSLKLKKKKVAKIPPLEGGTYMGVCIGVIDLGNQYNDHYKKYENKLMLMFEIPSETVTVEGEEKPRWLSREYTASLNEKSVLCNHLISWRSKAFTEDELSEDGDGFDITTMLGQSCMLTVVSREGDSGSYSRIENISAMPKGVPAPKTESELWAFDIDNRDEDVFAKLPEWIQTKIKKSTQYADKPPEENLDFPDDDGAGKITEEEECPI